MRVRSLLREIWRAPPEFLHYHADRAWIRMYRLEFDVRNRGGDDADVREATETARAWAGLLSALEAESRKVFR